MDVLFVVCLCRVGVSGGQQSVHAALERRRREGGKPGLADDFGRVLAWPTAHPPPPRQCKRAACVTLVLVGVVSLWGARQGGDSSVWKESTSEFKCGEWLAGL